MAILKKEEVNLKEYETFEEAKMALFEFIEGWYNRRRIHSAINYQIPYEIEKMSNNSVEIFENAVSQNKSH